MPVEPEIMDQGRGANSTEESPALDGTEQQPGPVKATQEIDIRRREPEHPIEYWRERLIGKRMIKEDEEGDGTTFKRSDLPEFVKFLPGAHNALYIRSRLSIAFSPNKIVENVAYG